MYIVRTQRYYIGTSQAIRRAPFLLLLQLEMPTPAETCRRENTYGVVRKVAMEQCGHFMMGRANLGGVWYTLSGSYGNDGLPMDVKKLPRDAVLLPTELYDAWNQGGGWNGAGDEARAMAVWAMRTFQKEVKRGK